MKRMEHEVEFCVVGGGVAGVVAAIAAARQGVKTAIIQDRPVFGGNASSEIRVHICGADRHNGIPNMRETGILEEIRLENLYRNPQRSFSVFDTILYEKIRFQDNLTYFLNCSVLDADTSDNHIDSITGWQSTTETYHTVKAKMFADCSGDGILAPLSGAEYRVGREARSEYDESIQPEVADKKTMGITCLFQGRDTGAPVPFIRPEWAYEFKTDEDLPPRSHHHLAMGYWWIELGGKDDSIHDTESLRDELLRITYGVWDHLKNRGDHGAENWALEWIQFLPGKRESRRYIGDHVLTQNDIAAEGKFDDMVAYGGWSMDDHDTAGFWSFKRGKEATIFHKAPSPYGIPYRSLYSKNIDNLFFAGRCASCTHAAMSSTRVMGTGAVMGQAAGIAAGIALWNGISPRRVGTERLGELQRQLQKDDCYLPWHPETYNDTTNTATITDSTGADASVLRNGVNRPVGDELNAWESGPGGGVTYAWDVPNNVNTLTLIVNSAMDRDIAMSYHQVPPGQLTRIPEEMIKDIDIEIDTGTGWETLAELRGNYQRLVRIPVNKVVKGIRATFLNTWGHDTVRIYGMYVD